MEFIEPYYITVLVLGLLSLVFFVQLLIADVLSLKAGHTPGHPVTANHDDILFRANRAISNTNESVAIFILATSFAMLSAADPEWLGYSAIVYLVGRVGHMCFYYSNLQLFRSLSFGISLTGLSGIMLVGFLSWL